MSFLLLEGTSDHLLLEGTSDALLLEAEAGPAMSGEFGALTATMIGTKIVSGSMVAAFGSLVGTLVVPFVIVSADWEADVRPSPWRADLKALDE